MRSSTFFPALVALFSLAIQANVLEKRAFSVPHRRQENGATFDGVSAMRKAYLKHGLELPENLQTRRKVKRQGTAANTFTANTARATASVEALTVANDLEYLSPISIGGTTVRLDLDTGSSDIWVFSDHLPSKQQSGHSIYPASQKPDQLKQGFSWKIAYGDGSGASGMVYADRVQVGEATATTQAVEAATSISTEFVDEHSDGLLGLGFGHTNTIKPEKQRTFFENIKDGLKEPIFTVTLKKNATGSYDFGYIDQRKYSGQLQYAPVNTSRGYWEYTLTGYSVGNDQAMTPVSYQSIADTGTTLMLLPKPIVDAYYKKVANARSVPAEGGYVFPCNTQLPDLKVNIGSAAGVHAACTIPGHFFDRGLSDTGSGQCYGGLQVGQDKLSIWGDVFLKSQFVVFDGGKSPRIGFAPQAVMTESRVVQPQEAFIQVAPPAPSASIATVATVATVGMSTAASPPAAANTGKAPIMQQSSTVMQAQQPTVALPTTVRGQATPSPTPSTASAQPSQLAPSYIRWIVEMMKNWLSSDSTTRRVVASKMVGPMWSGAIPHGRRTGA